MCDASTRNEKDTIANIKQHPASLDMAKPTRTHLQNCPVCGRPLAIPHEYLGRRLHCRHCGGKFVAIDPASPRFAAQNGASALLTQADRLLELCARKKCCAVAG
jgi:rRNA maturation protein Nop10